MLRRWRRAAATLFPGYFALVMATGILAVGASQQDLGWLADGLFGVAGLAYVVLAALSVTRLVGFRAAFVADATSHAKGFAFLTVVAATNVLGSGAAVIHGWWGLAWALWYTSLALWAVLVYTTLIAVVVRSEKPALGAGINASWFLLTVATESIAVLGALLLRRAESDLLAFVSLGAFTLGFVLYLIVMTMLFMRWTFQPLDPTELEPPAWIAAGAVAITVLAGSNLLLAADRSERVEDMVPFVEGIVIAAWATATFWFPLMVAIGVFRHVVRGVPLRYHPAYWSLVFPLGMYGVATTRMRDAVDLEPLGWLPTTVLVIALVSWTLAAAGLAHHLVTALRRPAVVDVATGGGRKREAR